MHVFLPGKIQGLAFVVLAVSHNINVLFFVLGQEEVNVVPIAFLQVRFIYGRTENRHRHAVKSNGVGKDWGAATTAFNGSLEILEFLDDLGKGGGSICVAGIHFGDKVVDGRCNCCYLRGDGSLRCALCLNLRLHVFKGRYHGVEFAAVVGQSLDGSLEGIELIAVVGQVLNDCHDGVELRRVVGQSLDCCFQECKFAFKRESLRINGSLDEDKFALERGVQRVNGFCYRIYLCIRTALHRADGINEVRYHFLLLEGLVLHGGLQERELVLQ